MSRSITIANKKEGGDFNWAIAGFEPGYLTLESRRLNHFSIVSQTKINWNLPPQSPRTTLQSSSVSSSVFGPQSFLDFLPPLLLPVVVLWVGTDEEVMAGGGGGQPLSNLPRQLLLLLLLLAASSLQMLE